MDDALFVRRFERLGDLPRDREYFIDGEGSLGDPIGERRPFHQFQHERLHARRLFETVDRADVRMIQRGEDLRFTFEAREPFNVQGKGIRQDHQRDVAMQPRIARAMQLAHAARPEGGLNLVRAEARTGGKCHAWPR